VGGLLAGFLPFRHIFVITGVLISAGALLVIRYLEEPPRATHTRPSAAANLRFVLSDGPLRLGLLGLLVSMAAQSMVLPVFPLFVEDLVAGAHDASVWTGIGFAVVAGFTMISAVFVGRIAKRFGLKTVLLVSLVITSIALAAHPFARGLPSMLAARALLGVGVAGVQPALYAMISRRAPGGAAGAIQGYASSAAILGFFFGPSFGGWFANRVGVVGVFYMAAAVALACAVFAAVVAKRRGRDRTIVTVPDPLPR
jgi:MFS family permease